MKLIKPDRTVVASSLSITRWETNWVMDDGSMVCDARCELKVVDDSISFQEQVVKLVQQRLDNFAKTRNYDSILSAATYANSSVTKFRLEGQHAVDVRDNTWSTLYTVMEQALAGVIAMPTTFEEVENLLPELVWPTFTT